ncbi:MULTISPECIES: iron-containing alcohol dehydrogenase [unclassified Paracoccus (in: a-proteobacteria)]|uniref:iron-containing alcohol dehydrogenase n=1 Tax=unclassified Paracoccus (in: a-proteobacteria) TaxID=2688777 RepID=UPI0021E18BBE|nr:MULTISPECIES: iron-containing alcohol dehydrogenase [unclassified Paracoccus (in: a-proteobacteria)]UXU75902.1 iron-containing alcohol dehydrogenase [Paracoccus sp. SMMA_5]UXU81812.1 iron-containing alcohol dehydrogenase [Paracoccus sp. SMMA_5_TC]
MSGFSFALPGRVVFGRGQAQTAAQQIVAFGGRGVLVHGADAGRAAWLVDGLRAQGAQVLALPCAAEPSLPMLQAALAKAKPWVADWVAALGGGAALDLGKALAALIPAPGGIMDHLEVVGRGLPLAVPPLPFIALPTTAGTGAEATRNAVIGLPDHGRKVSIRDERMLPRLAIVDPALTDHCPRAVTLASGLDALAQVVEPYVSIRANPFTDALTMPAIPAGLRALTRLMQAEDAGARDTMAWVSLSGGIALANGGLGAVHGLAGVIGGVTPAAHGAICGALLGPVLRMNRDHAPDPERLSHVCRQIAEALGTTEAEAPEALSAWARQAGLPGLTALGLDPSRHEAVAEAALSSSSMKGNPFAPPVALLCRAMAEAG